MNNEQSTINNFRSEPFLWIHLAGIAVVPLSLQIVWLGLATGDPFPVFWFELLFLIGIGIIPVFWMQWNRPFDIFSILIVSLKPEKLTPQQQQILSLFKTSKHRLLSAIAALGMIWVLWQIYQLAPLAAITASVLPQWRIVGLLLAAAAFLMTNLFIQIPISVLGVLFTSNQKWSATDPYSPEKIPQGFTVPGFRVGKILPISETEMLSRYAPSPQIRSRKSEVGSNPLDK